MQRAVRPQKKKYKGKIQPKKGGKYETKKQSKAPL